MLRNVEVKNVNPFFIINSLGKLKKKGMEKMKEINHEITKNKIFDIAGLLREQARYAKSCKNEVSQDRFQGIFKAVLPKCSHAKYEKSDRQKERMRKEHQKNKCADIVYKNG